MKYLKKIVAIFLFLTVLTSCSEQKAEYDIPVISTYPYLEGLSEGSYSAQSKSENDSYKDCLCVVSSFYGNLLITDKISYENAISGVSYKISFGNYWGDETGLFYQDENGDNKVVTTETLIGLIPSAEGNALLAITGGIYGGRLHLIVDGETLENQKSVPFSGMPTAFFYSDSSEKGNDSKCFYIATEKALFSVDASDYLNGDLNAKITLRKYKVPQYWESLEINSMCRVGNLLYIGTRNGVLSFYADLERYTYYPVDYETAINGETV